MPKGSNPAGDAEQIIDVIGHFVITRDASWACDLSSVADERKSRFYHLISPRSAMELMTIPSQRRQCQAPGRLEKRNFEPDTSE